MQSQLRFARPSIEMRKRACSILLSVLLAIGLQQCRSNQAQPKLTAQPEVTENGTRITIPAGTADTSLFKSIEVQRGRIRDEILAPARIVLCASRSETVPQYPLFLFDSPDETSLFSALRQNSAAYERAKKTYDRTKDLYSHQSASGKEVEDANADLASATAAMTETEGKLRAIGIDPALFRGASAGNAWIISDIQESQLHDVKKGGRATVTFTSYPGDTFAAAIEAVGEVIDNASRTVKVRLCIGNRDTRFRPGMYATVNFGQSQSSVLAVPQSALITVQGKSYCFVQSGQGQFQRRDIDVGEKYGDSAIVLHGILEGERIVVSGAMLLKGLSFGY